MNIDYPINHFTSGRRRTPILGDVISGILRDCVFVNGLCLPIDMIFEFYHYGSATRLGRKIQDEFLAGKWILLYFSITYLVLQNFKPACINNLTNI